ncbi:MAG TPA: TerB family tellurite resistance protein [Thermoanaerobaculia bacterium]
MNDPIRMFFQRQMGLRPTDQAPADRAPLDPEAAARRKLHVAACALLLELAHADEHFTDEERSHIEAVMRRHFSLDEDTAQELIALAQMERAEAIDLYQFTRQIREQYDLGQKTLLAEIMWGVVMTDGEIAQHEAYMLRKIANLLDLKPGYLSEARKRAGGDEPAA